MGLVVNIGVSTTYDEAFAIATMLKNRKTTGPKPENGMVVENLTGLVFELESGLTAPLTVNRESGSTNITFGAVGTKITASIAAVLSSGSSLTAVVRAVETSGAGVLIPVTLMGTPVVVVDATAPTITSANPSGTFAENTAISGTLTANETVTWSKSGADQALVTLNPSTGVWSITATPDFETKASYSWTFIATDSAGNASNQSVGITITDVVEYATTVLTVLPNGDVVVESIGSTWTMVAERLPGGEISVTGGSGAAVFRYSTDDGVTWTEGTSPGIINELGEVIIEALGDAVETAGSALFDSTNIHFDSTAFTFDKAA